jgi:hypothetical protein
MSNYDPAKKRMLSETECREDEIVAFLLWILQAMEREAQQATKH